MSSKAAENIFGLIPLIQNINIKLCARCENGVKQILALITSDEDVVLHYTYGELSPVIKRVPWFTDGQKQIQAICFDPSATWLLVVTVDCSLYIIPALSLVDKRQKIDCKWSLNDVTHFPKQFQLSDEKPTTIVWWQTLDCNQNALVGFENGTIILISLTDGRYLGSCSITEAVKKLCLCQDNSLETVSLLINGTSGQQWRFVLEHHSTGYIWPPDTNTQVDESTRSRLYNLKQLGVDKLASLKQRLSEARGNRRDSQTSDTASESSHSESIHSIQSGPELLPHLCDTYFAAQYARGRYLFTAFYKPTSLLTVHAADVESAPLYVHKLPKNTAVVLLTDRLIYTVNEDYNVVSIISSQLSETRLEGDAEFNSDSLIAQFSIGKETIQQVFKLVDLTPRRKNGEYNNDKFFELPKTVEDLNIQKPQIDTCVIVTDSSVYKINISYSPVNHFVRYITEENDLERAEKLSVIFGLNMQELLEYCGDLLVSRGSYHSGIILYKQAKVHLLKRVLKLAVSADCKTLLKFVHLCLNASKVDMSAATKIHIGNLAVMAYTELILRYGGSQRVANTKEFMNFVNSLDCYDQTLAVNVACQAGIWNVLNILAKCRGLEPEVACAMRQILQSARAPKPTDTQFLLALSEPCLTQTLLLLDESAPVIFKYIRTNVEMFSIEILQRFACQLDPSQPCAVPVISHLFSNKKFSSSLDTTIESVDLENPDKTIVTAKDFIDTFLTVVINLISKTENNSFDLHLLENIDPPELPSYGVSIKKFPDLHPLSCGYEHAAVVRNNSVYTMGAEVSGCLGVGPFFRTSSSPKLVETLSLLKLKVLSVSCGKKHTLALTEFGMYAWGSNTYGQLGISYYLQDTSYPQILTSISSLKIVDIAAGQYHSIALTSSGKVYTWGWGIHGQLGHGDCDNEYYPKLLDFPHPVKQVAGGHAHSLILTCEGKLYGFGSNAFGQVNNTQVDMNKHTRPVWVLIMPDMQTPIEKISSSYFHNIAVTADQEVYIWGASPQELRFHSKQNNQKQSGTPQNSSNSWKSCVRVYSATKKPVDQVALGFRHFALIHDGKMFWGKIKEDDLSHPKMREEDIMNGFFPQKFLHVSCGLDYTMAMDHTGKLLAWGSESMEKILLGKPMAYNEHYQHLDCRFALFRNSRRVIKLPFVVHGTYDVYPIEVPGLPTMAITFTPADQRLLFSRNYVPYAIRKIENDDVSLEELYSKNSSFTDYLNQPFNFKIGNKTLHYALEKYFGHYDTDSILSRCLEVHNYQAAAKIAMLEGHFSDSLGFQLMAFKEHMKTLNVNLNSVCVKKNAPELNEKEQGYVELIVRNIQEDLNEKNLMHSNSGEKICSSPAHILSPSSSLDSIQQWGDDVEHQGGCESPCEMSDSGDIRQNISQYVQSLKNNENSPPISSVSKMVSEIDNVQTKIKNMDSGIQISDKSAKEIIDAASYLVEFYIKKIYVSENHILMQNILLKCIEFWLTNSLPVPILENILLKNMDKYFYPLSILLFCKNFDNNLDDEIMKDDSDVKPTSGFLKQFSTKFCLQLCSMVLENVNKS